jgi:hypothetical protein
MVKSMVMSLSLNRTPGASRPAAIRFAMRQGGSQGESKFGALHNVCYWHLADVLIALANVCFWIESGRFFMQSKMSANDQTDISRRWVLCRRARAATMQRRLWAGIVSDSKADLIEEAITCRC